MTALYELMRDEKAQELKQRLIDAVDALESEDDCDTLHDYLLSLLQDNEHAELWLISVFALYSHTFGAIAARRLEFI